MPGDWRSALYAHFAGRIELVSVLKADPTMICAGAFDPPPDLITDLERERRYLDAPGRYNETQALLVEPVDPTVEPMVMRYRTIEYAAVRALRRRQTAMDVLSASVLPVCWDTRRLYLQRRAATVDLAPSRLHCFAGAFQPPHPTPGGRGRDGASLVRTALRELEEETGIVAEADGATPMAMFKDNASGSLELVLLGLSIQPDTAARMMPSAEGDVMPIPFDELPDILRQHDEWSAGGRFLVLCWLVLDAGTRAEHASFGGNSALDAFWYALA